MDILWDFLVILLLLPSAVLVGMAPMAAFRRASLLRRKNLIFTRVDQISLILFDLGIFGVALWLLLVSTRLSIIHHFHSPHTWLGLIVVHAILWCFAIGMAMRQRVMRLQAEMTLSPGEERKLKEYRNKMMNFKKDRPA